MNNISIKSTELCPVRYDSTNKPKLEKLEKIACLYANVFADPPWNEYMVCSNNHFAGRDFEELCVKCKEPLKLAYPKDETISYISNEIGKPNGSLITFEDGDGEVYAAGWGFTCEKRDFNIQKYKSPEMQGKVEKLLSDNVREDSFFYLSEVMVDMKARQQGIATKIANLFLEKADELGFDMVMRTLNTSPMATIANKISMVRIIDVGDDSEIPERVLYVKKRRELI